MVGVTSFALLETVAKFATSSTAMTAMTFTATTRPYLNIQREHARWIDLKITRPNSLAATEAKPGTNWAGA